MTGKLHTIGTRAQVWHGTAKKTSGGLTKSDLLMNKAGRIVSKDKHFTAKKEMRLLKHGYGTKKGKFGFVKIGSKKHRKGSKKMRGGMVALSPLELASAEGIAGAGITDYSQQGSVGLQLQAGQAGGRRRMRGGSGMAPLSPAGEANWAGDGIAGAGVTDYSQQGSVGLQLQAGQAGGRRKGRGRKMRGGTGFAPALASVGSTDVQLRAGLGN